jgi:NAD+ diphosphatase
VVWFVFQDNRLLVAGSGAETAPPVSSSAQEPPLPIRRRQYVGTLDGRACVTAEADAEAAVPAGMSFQHLRKLWGTLPDELFWAAGTAFQVLEWDRNHLFCGHCGTPTGIRRGERVRVCPACGLVAYPRLSPAVIVAVVKERQILLARARRFPVEMYSVIAGFVNPGESLEECVQREVAEETGIRLEDIRYFGSQPWPFPNSLMVGFTARYGGGELVVDPHELVSAGWYSASDLPRIPDRPSIARRLIDWFVVESRA